MGDLENPVEPEKPDSELTQWRLRSRSCAVADMTGAAAALCGEQLQRVGRQLLHREVKTRDIRAPLPLPDLCVTALKPRSHNRMPAKRHRLRIRSFCY